MTSRPILFSAPMVRALQSGAKTQTRRVVKGWPLDWLQPGGFDPEFVAHPENHACPYGNPGDQLWVRETWAYGIHAMASLDHEHEGPWVYAADGTTQGRLCDRWHPSIHMRREASRITLELTGVRVERLQDISEADAIAEGCASDRQLRGDDDMAVHAAMRALEDRSGAIRVDYAVARYMVLWEALNGPDSWAANPWVWVLGFKRVT